jgi:hypothetical protein
MPLITQDLTTDDIIGFKTYSIAKKFGRMIQNYSNVYMGIVMKIIN